MSSKIRTFKFMHFSKIRTFKFMHFSKLRTFKNTYFQKLVLLKFVLSKTRTFSVLFSKLPCFKNSPFKVHLEFPRKIPCFFKNSPFRKKLTLQIPCFFQKNSVFYKIPRFHIFKSLKKHTKNIYFL